MTCLPIMHKIQTAQTGEEIYNTLVNCGLFPEKQKGCHKETRGKGNLLCIDQHILKMCKMSWKNIAIATKRRRKKTKMLPKIHRMWSRKAG